jgi:E3 ubiquitin-protein ligase TRIP12
VQVQLLGAEHNPDIMLLAARALTFLADVPGLTSSIVRHGAVPAFCARLLMIEYIDLAEQSLQALEKLSHEHPGSLLQHGGLLAVLSYLDFFPSSVQRTAVATAALMCTALGPSHLSSVKDALPILCNLLQYQDDKVVDNACIALQHIADAYAHDASLLKQLQEAGLINQALQLISSAEAGSAQTSVSTYFGMVRLLSTCASGYSAVAEQLLRAGIVDTLRQLLASCAMLGSSGSVTQSGGLPVVRTPDQLLDVLTLAHELLPAVPDPSAMLLADLPTYQSAAAAGPSAAAAAGAAGAASRTSTALTQFLQADADLVMTLCQSLLPLTLQVRTRIAARQCL